jgi:FAD/FMN-containing dehydrogenase
MRASTHDHATLHLEQPDEFRGAFRTDLLARALYAEGAGIARCLPLGVAVPADSADTGALVRWAKATGTALIPRGSGSGMAAGAVGPGVVVDLSRFTHIGPVDVAARRIRVGAGALRGDINRAALAHGLRFPVDPSSGPFCTIGGMVAANAAGARTLRFGATRPWVLGIRCVFDDGQEAWIHRETPLPTHLPAVARLDRAVREISSTMSPAHLRHAGVRKESSGYGISSALATGGHLVDLLVGSEGTLALFTEVELALIPVAGATATVLATFASLEAATACAVEAADAGATACELLDRTFLDVAEQGGPTGIPADAEAVLLMEVEGADQHAANAQLDQVLLSCRRNGSMVTHKATDLDTEHRLWELRHAASPILSRLAPRLRSMQFIEDGCVPPAHFPAYVRGVRAALAKADTTGVIFGHAGDAHAHVNPLVDTTQPGWRDRVHGLLDAVCELTAALGGTLAGEHGDGRLRAPLLDRVWSLEARAAFAHIKDAGDPSGILNLGCKVARPGDEAIGTLRHDPEAPPLPAEARAVLDDIERRRDWARFRLGAIA